MPLYSDKPRMGAISCMRCCFNSWDKLPSQSISGSSRSNLGMSRASSVCSSHRHAQASSMPAGGGLGRGAAVEVGAWRGLTTPGPTQALWQRHTLTCKRNAMYKNYSPPKEISHAVIYILLCPLGAWILLDASCYLEKKKSRGGEIEKLLENPKMVVLFWRIRVFISLKSFW